MKKIFLLLAAALTAGPIFAGPKFYEPKASLDEWGFRPRENECSLVNPPPFVWRDQKGAVSYDLEVAADPEFKQKLFTPVCHYNVWCADKLFPMKRTCYWRVRFRNGKKAISNWSKVRRFTVSAEAFANPMPPVKTLLARIPKEHPRIFLRPEELPELRKNPAVKDYFAACDKLLAEKIDPAEIKKYPPEVKRPSKAWMKMWWGNRMRVIKILDSAAILGFGHRLGGRPEYGQEAKRLLLACAKWDPAGASSMHYNDEAGMPYLSRFSRTYSYVNDLLSDAEKAKCRKVVRIRGEEAYKMLYPRLFYRPYASHANRMWHFLGEAGVVFYNEIPEAEKWLDAAMNYYFCVYPVWSDEDGGWHEGISYWREYMERFLWWAEIMQNTFGFAIPGKPFFLNTGYYAMYLSVPGTVDGGFADLAQFEGHKHALLMKKFAFLTGNPHFNWYAEQIKPFQRESLYLEFLRGAKKELPCKAPDDLPLSRLFRGNGLAVFNTNLKSVRNNTRVVFKSSPRGTSSHGYDANNSFLLNVNGERLLIRSGRRDMYASPFHKGWMWETKSENNVTVDGKGQLPMSMKATGKITDYNEDGRIGYVSGSAVGSYEGRLKRYDRQLVFLRPGVLVVVDTLEAPKPVTYRWHLHTPNPFRVKNQHEITAVTGKAGCTIDMLAPQKLQWELSDKFVPPIRKDIKLVQSHLTFTVPEKAEKKQFISVIRTFTGTRAQNLAQYRFSELNGKKLLEIIQAGKTDRLEITPEAGVVSINRKPTASRQ